jgi:hypothetical protein
MYSSCYLCILIVMFTYYYCYVFSGLGILFHCVVLCIVCVQMCTVLLPPGVNPIAVNKYIISYHISYHIISKLGFEKYRIAVAELKKLDARLGNTRYREFYSFVMEVCIIQLAQHSPVNPIKSRIHVINFIQIFSLLPHTKNEVHFHDDDQQVNAV